MTKEDLARYRKLGFKFDAFYDQMAVDTPKKALAINHIATTQDKENYFFRFIIIASELKKGKGEIVVKEINRILPDTVLNSTTREISLTPNGSSNYIMKLEKKVLENISPLLEYDGFEFKAIFSCDGLSAETKEFKVGGEKKEVKKIEEKKKTCYCNRDFTVQELKQIVIYLRKNELVSKNSKAKKDDKGFNIYVDDKGEIPNDSLGNPTRKSKIKVLEDFMMYDYKDVKDNIFFLTQTEQLGPNETSYEVFTKEINKAFKNYNINSCLRKIHFLAQAYLETQQFRKTYETTPNNSNISGGEVFRGRGFLQLTHDYNYKELYKIGSGKEPTEDELKLFVPKIAKYMKLACQGSAWYWDKLKVNIYADNDDSNKTSAAINRPIAINDESELSNINDLEKRILYVSYFKLAFDYENCKNK